MSCVYSFGPLTESIFTFCKVEMSFFVLIIMIIMIIIIVIIIRIIHFI